MPIQKESILYIDDDSINLSLFEVSTNKEFNVITLTSTSKAIEILKNHRIKVIVSDQRMPEENGIDFFKRITPDFPDIKKIILTAYTDYNIAVDAINEAGIYKYLQKPWKTDYLIDILKAAIREYDLHEENKALLKELLLKNQALEEAYTKIEVAYHKHMESEHKFSNVFSKSNDCMFILSADNEIIEANTSFIKLLGISKKTSNTKDLTNIVRQNHPVLLTKPAEILKSSGKSITEFELIDKNGNHLFTEINCNHIKINEKEHILAVLRDITERRLFEHKIVEIIIKTQEEVQSKYAKELHDGLGPLLSSLKMNIEALASPNQALNKEKIIDYSVKAIKDAINSVKEIANNLSPHILQRFGLINAVKSFIDQLKTGLNIEFSINSNIKERIPENIELILYRVVLECINNSIKHSGASKIEISFLLNDNTLNINISDNGQGFDVHNTMKEGKGMGIFNIQNRIKNIGGEFRIFSNKKTGTNINILIKI